jgi:membrane protease YdiL (CAAX protease family)
MAFFKSVFWDDRYSRLRAGWRLVTQFALMVVFLAVIGLLGNRLSGSLPRYPLDESMSMWVPVALLLSLLLSVWVAGRFLDRRRFADFGFRFSPSWWIDLIFGLVLGAVLMTGIFLIELARGWATITEMFWSSADGNTFAASIALILFTFLCVGIYEEIWNRGYLLKNLAEGLNFRYLGAQGAVALAAFGTAVIFGLFHATNQGASVISTLALVLAGVLYATAYVLTGELAIPIGYHIAWNFFEGAVFGFPVSGYSLNASLVAIQVEGSGLWTGGAFGPEAGLLGILARVSGILLIVAWVRLRYRKLSLREEIGIPSLRINKRA